MTDGARERERVKAIESGRELNGLRDRRREEREEKKE